jgi:iron uptake system component EfeO
VRGVRSVPFVLGRPAGSAVALSLAVGLLLSACGSDPKPSGSSGGSSPRTIKVGITDAGCDPQNMTIEGGAVTFEVTNKGTSAVTEYEVLSGERIIAEKENLTPGLSGSFTLDLDPGVYTLQCPGGSAPQGTLRVTGAGGGPDLSAEATTAVADYRTFLERETDQLVPATKRFAAAVIAGRIDQAKDLFPRARTHYEAIEPVAESFGDLDPEIDARANDVATGTTWTGFHRIEKALWVDGSTAGMAPIARKLVADVTKLQTLVKTVDLQPAQIANGASELLDEVSTSKITGEEDRYSHTDLWDFEANVKGSLEAFTVLRALATRSDPTVVADIDARFQQVQDALDRYRQGEGFVSYTDLTKQDVRSLAQAVDSLAEPLSQVGALVVNAGA